MLPFMLSFMLPFVGDWESSFSSNSSSIVGLLTCTLGLRLYIYGVLLGVTFGDCFGEGANLTTFIVVLSMSYLDLFFLDGDEPPLWATLLKSPMGALSVPTDESFPILIWAPFMNLFLCPISTSS